MIIDASVRAVVADTDEIRKWMTEPWSLRMFPGPERYQYAAPKGEYWPGARLPDRLPGSDPEVLGRQLFDEEGVDVAIVFPRTRGLNHNVDMDSELCAATNRWQADTWLGDWNEGRRYRGTIRVAPADPRRAVAEIERWADHPDMVQVGVPMQAHQPYGKRQYLPIWEAAAAARLPVAVLTDGGASVDFHPTPAGYVRYAIEYGTLYPLNFSFHLASFIAEGVFDRLEDFKVVFADGCFDMLPAIVWRLDKDWRPTRVEMPWTEHTPSDYLRQHVRFCWRGQEGPDDPAMLQQWLEIGDAEHLLMFASNYPERDYEPPSGAFAGVDESLRRRMMATNAQELYGIEAGVPESPSGT
jgi:predicted TIM-barrel fold metal-dependent hydrolase